MATGTFESSVRAFEKGNVLEALRHAKQAKEETPLSHQLHNFLGILNYEKHNIETAIYHWNLSILLEPSQLEAYHNLIDILLKQKNIPLASHYLIMALTRFPSHPPFIKFKGMIAFQLNDFETAYQCFKALLPIFPELASELGTCAMNLNLVSEAISIFNDALLKNPNNCFALHNFGVLMERTGNLYEAQKLFEKAIQLNPQSPEGYACLAQTLSRTGNLTLAYTYLQKACHLHGNHFKIYSIYLYLLLYLPLSQEFILKEHKRFASQLERKSRRLKTTRLSTSTLRIGLLSGNFRRHVTTFFLYNIFKYHSAKTLHISCYNNGHTKDEHTQLLHELSDQWHDIRSLETYEASQLIAKQNIQILIELDGFTSYSRLDICASKPAPVQISYMGYPHATGLKSIDYRISDSFADPPSLRIAEDPILYLDPSFLSYSPIEATPPIAPPPCKQNKIITFGSFNNIKKINDNVLTLWSNCLCRVPNSRLIIKYQHFRNTTKQDEIIHFFSSQGVSANRIIFLDPPLSRHDHLNCYKNIDIALDTFPYNGTTTTCESLWMGVPVITLVGNTHRSRTTYSILTNAGLDDWVATTPEDYVAIAQEKSRYPNDLEALRFQLQARLLRSPLMDGEAFAKRFTETLAKVL